MCPLGRAQPARRTHRRVLPRSVEIAGLTRGAHGGNRVRATRFGRHPYLFGSLCVPFALFAFFARHARHVVLAWAALVLDCLVFGTWAAWLVLLNSLKISTTFEPLSPGGLLSFIPVGAALLIGSMTFQASRLTRATWHLKRTERLRAQRSG